MKDLKKKEEMQAKERDKEIIEIKKLPNIPDIKRTRYVSKVLEYPYFYVKLLLLATNFKNK